MRSLGEFVGHIWKGASRDLDDQSRRRTVTKRQIEEETRQTDAGPVTLRRTTIEEIEVQTPKESQ